MAQIALLSQETIDKIAAGDVRHGENPPFQLYR